MAMNLSRADLARAASRAESMRNRMANLKKRTEKVAERAVHTLECGSAAFGFGVLHGKTFDAATNEAGLKVMGVPLELLAGAALHGAGFLGLGGKMSSHLHGFGDGAIAAYLTTTGVNLGLKMAEGQSAGGGSGILENFRTVRGIGKGAASQPDEAFAAAVRAAETVNVP